MNITNNAWARIRAASLAVALAVSAPVAVGADNDVVFIVDGSGSISSADWTIQKSGISAAVQDPLVVPLDGSVGAAVVQFSGNAPRTRIEVPYRIISNAADRDAFVGAVSTMIQKGGGTNPGDGINAAFDHLVPFARPIADQVLCMSTDGTTNTGTPLSSAVAGAQAAGMDKYSVLAINDLPFFDAADAVAHYGPHVFGGGAVVTVQNSVEFANTVGTACLGAPIKLVGLEVTQAVQDLENSAKLVENKKTLVRAYLEPDTGTDPVKAQGRLKGTRTRDGSTLPGSPLTAINPGGAITAKPDALDRRATLGDSLNFRLPTSWTSGNVTLELESVGSGLNCKEVAGPIADDCKANVAFNSGSEVEVKLFKVKWKDGATTRSPSSADLNNLENRLLAMFPTAKIDRTTGTTIDMGTGVPALATVNSKLETARLLDFCWDFLGCKRLYYGALRNPNGLNGLANGIPGQASSSIIKDGDAVGRNVHNHEILHTLGRHHAVNSTFGTGGSQKHGACGSVGSLTAPDFPFISTIGGNQRATIGPMTSGDQKLMFGWDSLRNKALDPNVHYEVMSYCGNTNSTSQWISSYTWEGARGIINSNFSNVPPTPPGSGSSFKLVRGQVDFDAGTVSFDPTAAFEAGLGDVPPVLPTGNFDLLAKDAGGATLSTVSFDPIRSDPFEGDPSVPVEQRGFFLISVPEDPAIRGFSVEEGGVEVASITATAESPTVTVVSPNGGEVWSGTSETISWTATDTDSMSLTYNVQFSDDNGATWQTLALDLVDTSLAVNPQELPESTQALVRVQASDGFNTGEDVSDAVFTTPNSPPDCNIDSPTDGVEFSGVQTVDFQAFTNDIEDGSVANVAWTSNLDGPLGNGDDISKGAETMSEGDHTITMTCTDSGGLTDTGSVNISVVRVASPPPPAFIPGDANGDGVVDRLDRRVFLQNIGNAANPAGDPMDLDGDGQITGVDAGLMLQICTNPRCR